MSFHKTGRPEKFAMLAKDPQFTAAASPLVALFPKLAPSIDALAKVLIAAATPITTTPVTTETGNLVVRDRAAAKMLGIHYNSVRAWAAEGKLTRVRLGRIVGVTRESIEKLVAASTAIHSNGRGA